MIFKLRNPFEFDPFAVVWRAFRNLFPDKECQVWWEPEIRDTENGETVHGLTDFDTDNGSVMVFVSPQLSVQDAIEILAHELAHVAAGVDHDHDEVWEDAFNRIHDEYSRLVDEVPLLSETITGGDADV